jgi:hypothetical protein
VFTWCELNILQMQNHKRRTSSLFASQKKLRIFKYKIQFFFLRCKAKDKRANDEVVVGASRHCVFVSDHGTRISTVKKTIVFLLSLELANLNPSLSESKKGQSHI